VVWKIEIVLPRRIAAALANTEAPRKAPLAARKERRERAEKQWSFIGWEGSRNRRGINGGIFAHRGCGILQQAFFN
jgi:hypothetical protein